MYFEGHPSALARRDKKDQAIDLGHGFEPHLKLDGHGTLRFQKMEIPFKQPNK